MSFNPNMQTEFTKYDFTQRFTDPASTKRKTNYAALFGMAQGLSSTSLGKLIIQNRPNARSHSPHPGLLAMSGFPASIL